MNIFHSNHSLLKKGVALLGGLSFFLCEHNRLISPYNKKERSFFEEIVAISCVCKKNIVPLQSQ